MIHSIRVPRRVVWGRALLILIVVSISGGCMAGDTGKGNPNDPLPRMSRGGAESWAEQFVASMARSAEVRVDPKTVRPGFTRCVGKNDEVADDGRFQLHYSARAPLEPHDYAAAVKRVRSELEKRDYRIDGYQEKQGSVVSLSATNVKKGFFVSVEGYHGQRSLLFVVMTPCLLPPGVEQQQW
jgi:hypothetical protein